MGWSYGGYMTSWAITQTNRFKAAAVGAGVTNLWSMAGTTDILDFLPDYFSAEPSDNLSLYLERSPMYHAKAITTPTLILHGDADLRVPISQGYELYNTLKRRGVTAEMVVYPGMTHGPGNPETELDLMQRHLDWIERHVR
ncbi:MAG: prolyl oligopeptidase family serine peptidase, partial [Bryobacteraceae bacterium]|nr:prolyl oligopeptidase family serine peptidase [Bryobacteraceae bacterium]